MTGTRAPCPNCGFVFARDRFSASGSGGYVCPDCRTVVPDVVAQTPATSNAAQCSNCGAAIYAQWWNRAENAYQCRVCGTLNSGTAPKLLPPTRLVWPLWGCAVIVGILTLVILVPLYRAGTEPSVDRDPMGWFWVMAVLFVPFTVGLFVIAAVSTWLLRRKG